MFLAEFICTNCGYQGKRRAIKPGSRGMEIILWVVFLIPGPFYTLWRMLGKKWKCPQCEQINTMFSVGSKLGKLKLDEINSDISDEKLAKIPNMWEADVKEYNKKHGIINQPKTIIKEKSDKDQKW